MAEWDGSNWIEKDAEGRGWPTSAPAGPGFEGSMSYDPSSWEDRGTHFRIKGVDGSIKYGIPEMENYLQPSDPITGQAQYQTWLRGNREAGDIADFQGPTSLYRLSGLSPHPSLGGNWDRIRLSGTEPVNRSFSSPSDSFWGSTVSNFLGGPGKVLGMGLGASNLVSSLGGLESLFGGGFDNFFGGGLEGLFGGGAGGGVGSAMDMGLGGVGEAMGLGGGYTSPAVAGLGLDGISNLATNSGMLDAASSSFDFPLDFEPGMLENASGAFDFPIDTQLFEGTSDMGNFTFPGETTMSGYSLEQPGLTYPGETTSGFGPTDNLTYPGETTVGYKKPNFFERLWDAQKGRKDPLQLLSGLHQMYNARNQNKQMRDFMMQLQRQGFPHQNYFGQMQQFMQDPQARFAMLQNNPAYMEARRYAEQAARRRNARTGDINSGFGEALITDALGRNAHTWDQSNFSNLSEVAGTRFNNADTQARAASGFLPAMYQNNNRAWMALGDAVRRNTGYLPEILAGNNPFSWLD